MLPSGDETLVGFVEAKAPGKGADPCFLLS
jgi:hypothetical protein